jgi:hypothetical protein
MNGTTRTSKFKFVAALGAIGCVLATTLALASSHPVATSAQTSPAATVLDCQAEPQGVTGRGPLQAFCSQVDSTPCPSTGQMIHCTTADGGFGHCFCVDHEWACF